jgi:predicted transcriptional regulator
MFSTASNARGSDIVFIGFIPPAWYNILVTKILQKKKTPNRSRSRAELLESLEKGFRDSSTAGIMLHQVVADQLGLHITDHKCMSLLGEFGPLSAGKLAELTGLTTGAITGVLNRLEKRGYARRVRNPKDKRNISVEAANVEEFSRQMQDLLGSLHKKMTALSSRYTIEEMTLIDGFIKTAVEITREETFRLRSQSTPRIKE